MAAADVVQADDGWYIHLADPGFPDPPYPGERRLGPYTDDPHTGISGLQAATDQAVSDAAQGMGVAVGVYHAAESAKRVEGTGGRAHHSRSVLAKRADTLRQQLAAARQAQAKAVHDAVAAQYAALEDAQP